MCADSFAIKLVMIWKKKGETSDPEFTNHDLESDSIFTYSNT